MSITPYNRNAQKFFNQYQSLTFEQVHSDWLPLLEKTSGLALDVGAGSGRDALALAERGWDVVAVEPAAELRRLGEAATVHRSIQWVDDSVPDLSEIRKLSYRFDLILVSAVWMHVAPASRERAFRILTELLVSRLVNSLTYCVTLGPLAKAPVRRCGGSTSRAGNTGQRPQRHALREPLRALIAAFAYSGERDRSFRGS